MHYELNRLGPDRFEEMTQALSVATFGAGTVIFGDGPDGGREATFSGTYPQMQTDRGAWAGYCLLQSKYKSTLYGPAADQKWLLDIIQRELRNWQLWTDLATNRRRRPDYLLFATNVPLTAVADTGGRDKLTALFEKYRDLIGLRDMAVWDGISIERMLDVNHGVRTGYGAFITPGDVLERLAGALDEREDRVRAAWASHSMRELRRDTQLALGESGHTGNRKLDLGEAGIDVPLEEAHLGRSGAISAIIAHADRILRPSLDPVQGESNRRIALIGEAGQGKSTLSRLLCHVYRAAMLGDAATSVPTHILAAARKMTDGLADGGIRKPSLARVAVRVVLTEYAALISGGGGPSLLRFVASCINKEASDTLSDGEVRRLLRTWPSMVILDGLDEVAAASTRATLSQRIDDFMNDMHVDDADMLLICTTRPYGAGDVLEPGKWATHILRPLKLDEAQAYASRLLNAHYPHDADARARVLNKLSPAPGTPVASMLRTPLQVTIMTVLLDGPANLPTSRHDLFDRYFTVIYDREVGKGEWYGAELDRHRTRVVAVHEQAGLAMHRAAELKDARAGALSEVELEQITRDVLTEDGYVPGEDERDEDLVEKLVRLSRTRLVLLTPQHDGVGFEVRSLQEYMAARAIVQADSEPVHARLRAIAVSAHWRNVWLLAAGRVFGAHRHMRRAVVDVPDAVDGESLTAIWTMPGAKLAVNALHERVAAGAPQYEVALLRSALRLLDGPDAPEITSLAAFLIDRQHEQGFEALRAELTTRWKANLADRGSLQLGTLWLFDRFTGEPGPLASEIELMESRYREGLKIDRPDLIEAWDGLPAHEPLPAGTSFKIPDYVAAAVSAAIMREGLDEPDLLMVWTRSGTRGDLDPDSASGRLFRARDAVVEVVAGLGPDQWQAARDIDERITSNLAHDFVGHLLDAAMAPEAD